MGEYKFKDLCSDIKTALDKEFCKYELRTTKETRSYMWIATKNYDIGSYPMHYEIRKVGNNIYPEIHYESYGIIAFAGKGGIHRELQEVFVSYFDNKDGFTKANQGSNPKCYKWYRISKSGVKFKDGCVEKILAQLWELVDATRDDLLGMMEKVFV